MTSISAAPFYVVRAGNLNIYFRRRELWRSSREFRLDIRRFTGTKSRHNALDIMWTGGSPIPRKMAAALIAAAIRDGYIPNPRQS
jgi:hypothetical protein